MAREEKRRDPGDFYPGGSVWVKPGQSQPQVNVKWGDVTGKPQSFPPSAHAHAQGDVTGLADALAAKRDKTDESAYDIVWECTPGMPPGVVFGWFNDGDNTIGWGPLNEESKSPVGQIKGDESSTELSWIADEWGYDYPFTAVKSIRPSSTHKLARRAASAASALAKFDADGNLVADTDTTREIAKKADEFTQWEFGGSDKPSGTLSLDYSAGMFNLFVNGVPSGTHSVAMSEDSVAIDGMINNDGDPVDITALRTRVLRTDDVVPPSPAEADGKAAGAKATGDALDKKADEFTEWVPGDGAPSDLEGQPYFYDLFWNWKTSSGKTYAAEAISQYDLEASFAGVGASFHATRKRILRTGEALAPGLDAQGVPTDANVAELFSESNTLFKRGVRYAHSTFAFGSGEKLKDRAINALTFTASSASHTFDLAAALPTATDGFVRDFLVRLVSDAKVTFETGTMDIRGDGLAMEDGAADMLITLTEIASGVWYVRSIDITATEA